MTITASSLLTRCARELNDEACVRWTVADLVAYFNDGQRDIAAQRPDTVSAQTTLALEPGYLQAIPADGDKLLRAARNAGAGMEALTLVSRALLDAQSPKWRSMRTSNVILHYCFDVTEPTAFEVYPPAGDAAAIVIEYARRPVDCVNADGSLAGVVGSLGVTDLLANAMRNYVLFRAYSKQTEAANNPTMATAFYTAYVNDLGVEAKGVAAVSPAATA